MLRYAIILASLTAGAFAGTNHPSFTAKNATDYECKGPNAGDNVFLELETSIDSGQWECIEYQPSKDANVFVTFGYPWMYSIDVFSDKNCKTLAAPTIVPPKDVEDTKSSDESTKCVNMKTAGWADWQSVKLNVWLGSAN